MNSQNTRARPLLETLQQSKLSQALFPAQRRRELKIEADGDPWSGKVKPKIRLRGNWLARAGFHPGGYVNVKCIAAGVMELRSDRAMEKSCDIVHA